MRKFFRIVGTIWLTIMAGWTVWRYVSPIELGMMRSASAFSAIIRFVPESANPDALDAAGRREATRRLARFVVVTDLDVRRGAVKRLGLLARYSADADLALPPLVLALVDADPDVARSAFKTLRYGPYPLSAVLAALKETAKRRPDLRPRLAPQIEDWEKALEDRRTLRAEGVHFSDED